MNKVSNAIVVLVSGFGSNLQALIDASNQGSLPAKITAVISDREDAFGLKRAQRVGIPSYYIPYQSNNNTFDQAFLNLLEKENPKAVILAGFMRILSTTVANHLKGKLINIHPSLLPKYPGLKTYERVLKAGDSEHGCSVHYVTETVDAGPLIAQVKVPITSTDDINTLKQKVQVQEHWLYPLCVSWLVTGKLQLTAKGVVFNGNLLPTQGYQFDAKNAPHVDNI